MGHSRKQNPRNTSQLIPWAATAPLPKPDEDVLRKQPQTNISHEHGCEGIPQNTSKPVLAMCMCYTQVRKLDPQLDVSLHVYHIRGLKKSNRMFASTDAVEPSDQIRYRCCPCLQNTYCWPHTQGQETAGLLLRSQARRECPLWT